MLLVGGGVSKSTNGSAAWSSAAPGVNFFVSAIVVDPVDGNTVYAGTRSLWIIKSTNGGTRWEPVNVGRPQGAIGDDQLLRIATAPFALP
jgi:hypothetical protein